MAVNPLPDRPIYARVTLFSYVGAVFVHSWDECVRFWQTDWRTLSLGIIFPSLGLWFSYFIRGEVATVTDAEGIALTSVLPAVAVAVALYFWGVIKAPYRLHQRQLERVTLLAATSTPDGLLRLHDDVVALTAQLQRFVRERSAGDPEVQSPMTSLKREYERMRADIDPSYLSIDQRARNYRSATMALYDQQFAQRVMTVTRELRERGFSDERLRDYPIDIHDIRAIASVLESAVSHVVPPKA